MQKVYERVGDDPDVQQNGREAAVCFARKLEQNGTKQGQSERKQPLYQKSGQKAAHDGTHNGVGFKESSGAEQHRGAKPVGEIERVKKKQLSVKRIASECRCFCGSILFAHAVFSFPAEPEGKQAAPKKILELLCASK